jgi:cytosine/adenosine deaminase-related metal-dependent hydrolase
MTSDILLANVRPMGAPAANILVRGGRIAAIGPHLTAAGVPVEDCGGALALPGLVEAHTHLDKSLIGMAWYRNDVGPRLIDKIDNERRQKRAMDIAPARQSARQVVQSLAFGTTHIRSHVDIDLEMRLEGVEGVMATRERYRDVMDIEIVAFPQSGLLVTPGVLDLMDRALAMGAEVVGGLDPSAIDRDPKGHLDAIFGLAQKHGKPIDLHLHEPGELGLFAMELIVERTRALGMQGKVVVSHAFCLGTAERDLGGLFADLAQAGIAIMTTGSASRPVPPLARLAQMGVVVCSGSDGIRDTWGPYGNGDMLQRAMFLGLRNNLRREDEVPVALDACTRGGAAAMRLEGYGLDVGCWADLVLVDAETPSEAAAQVPPRRLVMKRGRVVARDGEALVAAP